jgi:hypothetical protein
MLKIHAATASANLIAKPMKIVLLTVEQVAPGMVTNSRADRLRHVFVAMGSVILPVKTATSALRTASAWMTAYVKRVKGLAAGTAAKLMGYVGYPAQPVSAVAGFLA